MIKELIKGIFKNSKGLPYIASSGQAEVFLSVIDPKIKWLWLSAPTRYGKSDVLAMAILYLAAYKKLKVPIVGGSEDKAKKIMEYVVSHLSDHPTLYSGLLNIQNVQDVDKLKVTVSKDALRWHDGGWIYITSVDSRSLTKEGSGVVGEGGDVVILEEAGLIKNKEQFSKVVRMGEEDKGWGKLIMSGNCVEQSVFEDAFNDPMYTKIRIDLEQAIDEGRFTREYLEQKKTQTTSKDWKRYYEVLFPEPGEFTYFKPKKYDVLPRDLEYFGAIDPALGEHKDENKGSKIGIIVLGIDKDYQLYEVMSIIKHMTPDEAMRVVFNLPYKFKRFVFEAIQFQKYFLKETKKLSKELGLEIPFDGITQTRNKLERIESLEPVIATGGILFAGDNQLWDDMQSYPNTEFLDGVDALEMAYRASVKKKPSISFGGDMF